MAQRGKVKLKRSGLNEEAMVFTMAEEGRSIWRSRSQPVVTYLHGGVILLLLVLCACTSARSQQPSGIRVVSTIAQIGCLEPRVPFESRGRYDLWLQKQDGSQDR